MSYSSARGMVCLSHYSGFWVFKRFQYSVVSLFIDSGAGLVLSTYMVCLALALNCESNFAKLMIRVWCSYKERTNRSSVYRCLLTNRLHGKAAEVRMFG